MLSLCWYQNAIVEMTYNSKNKKEKTCIIIVITSKQYYYKTNR